SRLNRSLDDAGRRHIVEMLWQIAYADHHVTEFEDNLIWRVADLLGVSSRERIELRQQVAAGPQGGEDGWSGRSRGSPGRRRGAGPHPRTQSPRRAQGLAWVR